jgi:hypothetical protein
VGRSGNTDTIVSVDYITKDATGKAGVDYTATNGTLTFAPDETAKIITVAVFTDLIEETNEALTVTLNSPTNATLGIPSRWVASSTMTRSKSRSLMSASSKATSARQTPCLPSGSPNRIICRLPGGVAQTCRPEFTERLARRCSRRRDAASTRSRGRPRYATPPFRRLRIARTDCQRRDGHCYKARQVRLNRASAQFRLRLWQPFGERLRAATTTSGEPLSAPLGLDQPHAFYRLLSIQPSNAEKLGSGGAEVLGS